MRYKIIGWLICLASVVSAAQDRASRHLRCTRSTRSVSRWAQTGLADLDEDGDLDWIVRTVRSCRRRDLVVGIPGAGYLVRHLMGKGNTDVGGAPYDVNGDGGLIWHPAAVADQHQQAAAGAFQGIRHRGYLFARYGVCGYQRRWSKWTCIATATGRACSGTRSRPM